MNRTRAATAADAEAIALLHAESWRATYRGAYRDEFLDADVVADRLEVWRERLGSPPPEQCVVVAEDRDELVGFACVYGGRDGRWGSFLDNIHVRSVWQDLGLGTRLLAEVVEWCSASFPTDGLHLRVVEQNTTARRFYERRGATDRDRVVVEAPGGGSVTTRLYAWDSLAEVRAKPRSGIISAYARAVERGEDPDPPMFFRPGGYESLDAFVGRVWESIQGGTARPDGDTE